VRFAGVGFAGWSRRPGGHPGRVNSYGRSRMVVVIWGFGGGGKMGFGEGLVCLALGEIFAIDGRKGHYGHF
jgi:hypothetical protein